VKLSWLERLWWLLRRAFIAVYEDGCLGIAKGAAYSGLLSFFPVLTTVALVLVKVKAEQVAEVISRFLFEVVPPGTQELVMRQFAFRGEKPGSLLVIAGLVSLGAASGFILSLVEGFNAVYHVPTERPLVHGRLVAIGLVFSSALPALCASAMIIFGARTELWLVRMLGVIGQGEELVGGLLLLGKLLRYGMAYVAMSATLLLLYKFGPNRPQPWRHIWPGSLVAALLWFLATLGFSWYVRNIADYNLIYGSIGTVIALLLWMYILSLVTLYGCAFNAERERLEKARGGEL